MYFIEAAPAYIAAAQSRRDTAGGFAKCTNPKTISLETNRKKTLLFLFFYSFFLKKSDGSAKSVKEKKKGIAPFLWRSLFDQ